MDDVLIKRPEKDTKSKLYSILYVDDEEVNLRIFQYSFRRDYNVFTALNGPEALRMLEDNKIDLIITDQQMPNMTGVDLLSQVVPKYPNIVRMIMTGFSDMGAIIRAVNEFGLDRYLVKPWDREELKEIFDKALEKRNEQKATEKTKVVLSNAAWLNQSITPGKFNFDAVFPESFIVKDEGENHNGYWYGERNKSKFLVFFTNNQSDVKSLNINSFVIFSLNEIVFKEKIEDPEQIMDRLRLRLIASDMEHVKVEMGMVKSTEGTEDIEFLSAGKTFYYYDSTGKLQTVGTLEADIEKGSKQHKIKKSEISRGYFLDSGLFKESAASKFGEESFILNLLDEVHDKQAKVQKSELPKKLSTYKEKCLISVAFA